MQRFGEIARPQAQVAALSQQAMLDPLILGFSDFHHSTIGSTAVSANTL
jgi:hypothetical protein